MHDFDHMSVCMYVQFMCAYVLFKLYNKTKKIMISKFALSFLEDK